MENISGSTWRTTDELTSMSSDDLKAYVARLKESVAAASGRIFSDEDKDGSVFGNDRPPIAQVDALQDSYKAVLQAPEEFREAVNALVLAVGTRSGIGNFPEGFDSPDHAASFLRNLGQNLEKYLGTL